MPEVDTRACTAPRGLKQLACAWRVVAGPMTYDVFPTHEPADHKM